MSLACVMPEVMLDVYSVSCPDYVEQCSTAAAGSLDYCSKMSETFFRDRLRNIVLFIELD